MGTNEGDHVTQDIIKLLIPGKEYQQMHYLVISLGEQALQDTTESKFLANGLDQYNSP